MTNSLKYKELQESHPKAIKALVGWVKTNLEGFQRVMMEQVGVGKEVTRPEITDEHAKKAAEAMLTAYPRTLYDWLDGQGFVVDVGFPSGGWVYVIREASGEPIQSGGEATRISAEFLAFREAIKLLEEKLP